MKETDYWEIEHRRQLKANEGYAWAMNRLNPSPLKYSMQLSAEIELKKFDEMAEVRRHIREIEEERNKPYFPA